MNFSVRHPQLEYTPGQYREGIKRYHFNKNMNSFEYPEVSRPLPNEESRKILVSDINSSSQSPEVLKLKQQLFQKQQELLRLKMLSETLSKSQNSSPQSLSYISPVPPKPNARSLHGSYDYNLFDIARHPAFQQPKFTKRSPKVVLTSPITGYSPERNLGHYGNLIVSSNNSVN